METKKILSLIVATIALAILAAFPASAFADITSVVVNGAEFTDFPTPPVGVFAGDTIPVRVVFRADNNNDSGVVEDVRIVARIFGQPGFSEVTERFDVLPGNTYSRLLNINLPFRIDPSEEFTLEVSIESPSAIGDSAEIPLEIQRASFELDILSIETMDTVSAGENLALDAVVKNRGRHEAEDVFVRASIPELGISRQVFLGDLSPLDQGGDLPEKDDSGLARIFLNIPSGTATGVYTVEVEAFTADSSTVRTKKIVISEDARGTLTFSSPTTRTFGAGEEVTYTITLVNSGDSVKIYQIIPESVSGLTITTDESIVAVPNGATKTISVKVKGNEEGKYNFAVNIHSDGELIAREMLAAEVEGKAFEGNATVLLTVILAIIFVVLLVVLIVLLTRKPEKSEELGESYY